MLRIMIRVKDKSKVDLLERYGTIIYKSPILNLVTLETKDTFLNLIGKDQNVLSVEVEPEGRLMPV
ncbi:hypothetical protein J7E52_25575 [Bacillus sp. ISL-34]|uniref:hypothetical protein n=1 Tax=Bacillus sp. ISL-34 TaxID=2819121 RepID=UPI001BEA7BE1|nr:hypothetical protein [Bacillus sp. ISL-34]MBT2650028.1 hypothetical protein [Bacillus sp. ISL-34]